MAERDDHNDATRVASYGLRRSASTPSEGGPAPPGPAILYHENIIVSMTVRSRATGRPSGSCTTSRATTAGTTVSDESGIPARLPLPCADRFVCPDRKTERHRTGQLVPRRSACPAQPQRPHRMLGFVGQRRPADVRCGHRLHPRSPAGRNDANQLAADGLVRPVNRQGQLRPVGEPPRPRHRDRSVATIPHAVGIWLVAELTRVRGIAQDMPESWRIQLRLGIVPSSTAGPE